MKGMTPRQQEIYDIINEYQHTNGYAPSFTDVERKTGISHTVVRNHILALYDKGYVTWQPHIPHSLIIKK
jgi:SOS-response transcriptional repressor LexA